MLAMLIGLAVTPSFASPVAIEDAPKMVQVRHVNPMPPYMRLVKLHAEELALSDEQQAGVNEWTSKNHGPSMALVQKIIALESEIATMSRAGESKKALLKKVDEAHEARVEAATLKVDCRDNLRTLLSDKQWGQVVEWSGATKE